MDYIKFLNDLDRRLEKYFQLHQKYINCKVSCSSCCEEGDYPLSQYELEYMLKGYIGLDDSTKRIVQENINNMVKGKSCPFLIDKRCSIYSFRPIICRVHGLAYLCKSKTVKVPYCVNENKNYFEVYDNGEITINPIKENLDLPELLKDFELVEIRDLYDWLKS